MRLTILLLSSLIAGPAVALTPEQQAVADCIRKQPIEDLINRRSTCALPAKADPFLGGGGAGGLAMSDARKIARFQARLPLCPSLKPGPAANLLWPRLWSTFTHVPPDKPAIRAYVAELTAEYRAEARRSVRDTTRWCDLLKIEFAATRMVVNNDGSKPERECRKTDTCGDPSYIYSY